MADSPSGPTVPCPGCGWANPPGVSRCEFCRIPLTPGAPGPPPRSRDARAPGPSSPGALASSASRPASSAAAHERPEDARAYPQGVHELAEEAETLGQRLREWLTPRKVVFGVIVLSSLFFFSIYYRANQRATSADNLRHVVQALKIFEGENGGYPGDLPTLERRYGPIPDLFKADAWGKPFRYQPRDRIEREGMDSGGPLFRSCDIRSAGPNGSFDDGDDIAWTGTASP